MKKTLITSLFVLSGIAQAHEVWVQAPTKLASVSVLKAELAYGDYPYVEKMLRSSEASLLKNFAQMEIIHQNGGKNKTLIQKGENNQEKAENALSESGSYWITATYKPTFWSKC